MEAVRRWRSDWRYPTTLLCIYGFFSMVRPMDPFLVSYMTGPDKNLAVLVPVFLLTDWLRYKPVVVFQCAMFFITTALLRWTKSVPAMQVMEFFYALVTASEVAYYSYIYSVVEPKRYLKATSYCRSVQLLGYTVGSVLGQLLVSFNLMSYNNIMALTLAPTAIALVVSCFLPMPRQSMFFHNTKRDGDQKEDKETVASAARGTEEGPEAEESVLWDHVQPSHNFSLYNGGVEAMSNLLSASAAYGIGFTEVRWEKWGEIALGGFSGLGAAALFLMTFVDNIWACYVTFTIFKCLYMLLITIATYQIAADLTMERYALVFGMNNFGALALQTILTSVVVDRSGLGLAIIPQFTIYASYFSLIAVVFSLRGLFTVWRAQRNKTETIPPDKDDPPDYMEHRF